MLWTYRIKSLHVALSKPLGLFLSDSLLLLESIVHQFVYLKKWKHFLLNDYDASRKSKFLITGGSPFLFNKISISKEMIDSFHTIMNRRKSFDNADSYFSMIFHNQDNWLNPVKPFHRSSLISSFYKAHRLRFLNNPHHFCFYWNTRFPFSVEKARINNYDLTYGQFLNILFIRNKKFSLCVGKKKHAFGGRDTISPIESQVSNIFIPNDFPQSGDERYNLSKSFHFPSQYDPFVRRTIYSIADICVRPRLRKVNFEITYCEPLLKTYCEPLLKTYCQPLLNMNLSDSEGKNLRRYLNPNGLIYTPCSEKYLLPKTKKRKKRSLFCRKCFKKGQMYSQVDSAFSTLSKWNLVQIQTYAPWVLTTPGYKYLKWIVLDTCSERLPILSQKFGSICHDIRHRSGRLWRILQKKWCLPPRISEIWSKCLQDLLLCECEATVPRNNESPFISTHLRSLREFLYSILFFLLLAGYLVLNHLFLVSEASSELQTEFEGVKSLMMESSIIEVRKLLDRYPTPNSFWLKFKNGFLVALEELVDFLSGFLVQILPLPFAVKSKLFFFKKNSLDINLIIDLILNPIHRITFSRNTRHLSHTSKEIYSLTRYGTDHNDEWDDIKLETWSAGEDTLDDDERQCYLQVSNLTAERSIGQILLSLTQSDPLSTRNDFGYQMIEQPGAIYLRYLVDIHKKYLFTYEFNTSCLAERRVFLAHDQTITSSQTLYGTNPLHFPYPRKSFSLRLVSPPKGVLVIGSLGIGRSYLVNYLATNSYLPFITGVLGSFRGPYYDDFFEASYDPVKPSLDFSDEMKNASDDDIEDDIEYDFEPKVEDMVEETLDYAHDDDDFISEISDRPLLINIQFEFAKALSPCILWLPNIHDLGLEESEDLSLGVFANHLSSTRNILILASTHIPEKVDPGLLGPDRFNTCIKIRRPLIPQQRKHFFTLSYTRGFHWEKKMFHTNGFANGFGSITTFNARDLAALTNEALSISITQKKSILDTNTIQFAFHRQIWELRDRVRCPDHGIFSYQIGRAVAQTVLLSNCLIDPISIYMRKKTSKEVDSYLSKWYFELGTSIKKLTILLYLLSCSAGSVAQDLWSLPGSDEKNWLTSYLLLENDSDLAHGLLELEGALVGSSRTEKDCSPFETDRVTLLLRPEPRNPLDMMQNSSIVDQRFLDPKSESEFEEGEALDPEMEMAEDLFNAIVCTPRIWYPWRFLFDWSDKQIISHEEEGIGSDEEEGIDSDEEEGIGEDDWDLLESGTLEYQRRSRSFKEQVFIISQFFWDPPDPLFLLFQDKPPGSVFSHREFFGDEEMSEEVLTASFQKERPKYKYMYKRLFIKNLGEKYFGLLEKDQRWFRPNSSLDTESFRSNTLSESYQYLSTLFLSNGTLLDQMTKTLLRKKWIFPDEMRIYLTGERFPIP
uniref:Ycf2 n=1 Tax=Cymbaria mongolica TaxID=374685 RepID=UPI00227728E3|nr:Ycf2 [Cymbaria mongolica]YP_010581740.1 Ycf2 [Cymbaria mongolica]UYS85103.1 Ycf2 [Cymbaria mongolica]UYS85109.1 Ycf2 [Cymbaria mongolica]